jgi:RNA polymerase sigma factor (sigma-70 family)
MGGAMVGLSFRVFRGRHRGIGKDFLGKRVRCGGMKAIRGVNRHSELLPTRSSLVERLRDLEDHGSWQSFFETYWKLIYCAAVRSGLRDSEAEEAVQETMIRAARHMGRYRYEPSVCSFKGWLMLLTRCAITDQFRKRSRSVRQEEAVGAADATDGAPDLPDPTASLAEMWEEEWRKNLVDAAMERVKRRANAQHYQIFHLTAVKGLSASEVGRLLNVGVAKVYVVRHRLARWVKEEVQLLEQQEAKGVF